MASTDGADVASAMACCATMTRAIVRIDRVRANLIGNLLYLTSLVFIGR
jgi:hypothetical protein